MSFLQSAFLIGLSLAALPLLLHLLARRRVSRVVFPALMLLEGTRRRSMRILTLQQWLVLLCRMAAIAMLVLAFAQPVLDFAGINLPGTRTRTAIHIIIDNSPSMLWENNGVTLFERAIGSASSLIAESEYEDEIIMELTCGDTAAFRGNAAEAAKAIKEYKPGDCLSRTDLKINRAVSALRNSPLPERRIVVFSDFQAGGFSLEPVGHRAGDPIIAGVNFSPASERHNIKIKNLEVPIFPLSGEELPVCFEIESDVKTGIPVSTSLVIDENKRGEQALSLEDAVSQRGCFSITFGETGRHSGHISISGDSMPGDNDIFFTFDIHDEIPVILAATSESVRDPQQGGYYIARAVRTISGNGKTGGSINLRIIEPDNLGVETVSGARVVIVPDNSLLNKDGVKLLGDFLVSGGGIFMSSTGNPGPDSLIARTLFGDGITITARDSGSAVLNAGRLDDSHALFSGLGGKAASSLRETLFFNPPLINAVSPEISTPGTLSDGSVFIAERTSGAGKILLLSSALSPEKTNLALKPAFAPLVLKTIKYLAEPSVPKTLNFTSGAAVGVPSASKLEKLEAVNVETGEKFNLLRTSELEKNIFSPAPGSPLPRGAYRIATDDTILFTINADPLESDLASISTSQWETIYKDHDTISIDASKPVDAKKLAGELYNKRATALWFPFLVFAIGFLLLESALSNKR